MAEDRRRKGVKRRNSHLEVGLALFADISYRKLGPGITHHIGLVRKQPVTVEPPAQIVGGHNEGTGSMWEWQQGRGTSLQANKTYQMVG